MNGCCPHLSPSWGGSRSRGSCGFCVLPLLPWAPISQSGYGCMPFLEAAHSTGLVLRRALGDQPDGPAGCGEPSVGWSALPALLLRCPSSGCSEAALAASYCRSFHFLGCWGSPSGSRTPGKRPARGCDSCKSELCSILTLDLSVPFFRGKGQEDQEEDEAAPSQGGRKEAVGGRVLPLW